MKEVLSALVLSAGLLVPALAGAQELGAKGDVVFSVERLMGVTGTKVTDELRQPNDRDSWTDISLGWRGTLYQSPLNIPRLAFDYLIVDHVSLGLGFGYASMDADRVNDASAFLFAPRVGYAYAFGKVVGIWPRAGLTYHSSSIDNGDDTKGLALSLDCPFTFSPATHFAFHVGPSLDLDMFGDRKAPNNAKGDLTYRTFGINAGILGWF